MADVAVPPTDTLPTGSPPTGSAAPPDQRGSLELRTKALTRLAEHAANEVMGTARDSSTMRRTLGRDYPHATASLHGPQATIEIDVAALWPTAVAEIAIRTRDHVLARSRELSGLDVRRVDVTVHIVTRAETGSAAEEITDTRRVV